MSLLISPRMVDLFVGALVAGIDVDGGPTPEQLGVLQAIVTHVWDRPDLELRSVPRVGPRELADALQDEEDRELFHELHMTLEACRHPQSSAQVDAVEAYADALGASGDDLQIFRDLVTRGVDVAAADYSRFLAADVIERFEPSLATTPVSPDAAEPELASRLEGFAEYGPGTLGRAFLQFYERFHLTLPGKEASSMNHFFVAHDMTHTIAGISTTIQGEIALSAFQFAMNNNRINRAALFASLVAHEAGFTHPGHLQNSEVGTLADKSAALLLARELRRGSECAADFSLVDHFELAPMPLDEVRKEFGVRAPVAAGDGHHFLW